MNPLQALHPNADGAARLDARRRRRARAASIARRIPRGCDKLRDVCTRRNIVLIFDEVFMGFRLARGGAQEYFGVRADLVTYGKTLGGGLPVGVICGAHRFMKRFRDDRPSDVCFARGTFNSHPYVMAAMNEFLRRLESDAAIARELRRPRRALERARPAAQRSGSRRAACRCASRTSSRSGPCSTTSRAATTGCSSTTCAPRGSC